jgi:predicted transcriptional regulator
MKKMRRLPDAEFEVMKAAWELEAPITASKVMNRLGGENKWVVQAVISFLNRLVKREFLGTEKIGSERVYSVLVTHGEYLKFETGNFIRQYHENSVKNFISTLNDDKILSAEDIEELFEWVKERKE